MVASKHDRMPVARQSYSDFAQRQALPRDCCGAVRTVNAPGRDTAGPDSCVYDSVWSADQKRTFRSRRRCFGYHKAAVLKDL